MRETPRFRSTAAEDRRDDTLNISRRDAVRGFTSIIVGGSIVIAAISAPSPSAANTKVPKSQAGYKNVPRGSARCEACIQYVAPAGCKIVDGEISPTGSCDFFAPRTS